MSRTIITFGSFAIAALFLAAPRLQADDQPAKADNTTPAPVAAPGQLSTDEVARLIRDLDANQFAVREGASQRLAAAGKSVIPELVKAATGESLEAAMRSIAILRRHIQEGDTSTRAAAKEALEKIAKSGNPAVAQAAQEALRSRPRDTQTPTLPGGLLDGQLQFGIGGARSRRYSMRGNNGMKEIESQDDERTVKITDDVNTGIKMEVTEKKDGKEETKKYQAKNADELKAKHPDAFKLYEEHSKPPQGMTFLRGQFPGGGFELPAGPPFPRQFGPFGRLGVGQDVVERLDRAQKQLDEATRLLKRRGEKADNGDDLRKALEQLEDVKKQLEEARASLGG